MKITFLLFLCCVSAALAEQPWPKQVAEPKFAEVETAKLPAKLREVMMGYDDWDPDSGGKLPARLRISRVDLRGDGTAAYLVENDLGGSGGPGYYIFERRGDTFVNIASLQDGFYFARRLNGYSQIVDESRAGGTESTRMLFRYEHGRYHLVRMATYQDHGAGLQWVRESDPRPFDH